MNPDEKSAQYSIFCKGVHSCTLCDRMVGSNKVIGRNCGSIFSNIMFIGEAPGRRGAETSLIPFKGDKSGENFEFLLQHAGLTRNDFYITNALLCNPKDGNRNGAPKSKEIRNCHKNLQTQIDLIDPEWIFSLGSIALKSLFLIAPHDIVLRRDVGKLIIWKGRKVVPLYHPGQRAMIHRSKSDQINDYKKIKELITK